jgi:tryptophan-rich sensory protein
MSRPLAPPSVSTVRLVVLTTIVLTLFHFTDNAVNVDTYPKAGWQPDWFEIVVAVAWVLYTAVGVAGFLLYQRGRFRAAQAALLVYGYLVISSLGHFIYGSPDELTTRGVISVFVDVAAGTVVVAVAVWSIVARRRQSPAVPVPPGPEPGQ